MSPTRRLIIGAIVLMSAAGGYAAGRVVFRPSERVVQPIAFNHKLHVEDAGLDCGTCHQFYTEGDHSGLPGLDVCMGCHEEPQTESAEERKVKDLADAGQNDVFRKVFRLADHAFYSHRRHVVVAGIDCATCHGDVAAMTKPPEVPRVRITMDFCMDCHRTSGVSSDCTRCHR